MGTPGRLNLDCWSEVFKRVEDPSDLKSLSETCVLFEEILRSSKGKWMSAVTLPLVFNYLNHIEDNDEENNSDPNHGDGGMNRIRRPFWQPMLRSRLVCKNWRHAIDQHLESNPERDVYPFSIHPTTCSFQNEQMIDEFLQTFENHRGNPFVGRRLCLESFHIGYGSMERRRYSEEEIAQQSRHHAKEDEFLKKFGQYFYTLEFRERDYFQHPSYCRRLQALLTHLPNLRNVKVHHRSDHRYIMDFEELEQSDEHEGIDELERYLAVNPVPCLNHLDSLDAQGLSFRMGQALLEKSAPTLKSLIMWRPPPTFSQFVENFRCLRELELWVDAENTLEYLRQLHSPLQKLTVQVRWNRNRLPLWAIDKFLRNIEHLSVLELGINCTCFIGESSPIPPSLQLPSIKRVQIVRGSRQMSMSFNFMLCFPNLKEIELMLDSSLDLTFPVPRGAQQEMMMLAREHVRDGDLYSSDIWERIPTLSQILSWFWAQNTKFTREGYEQWLIQEAEKTLSK